MNLELYIDLLEKEVLDLREKRRMESLERNLLRYEREARDTPVNKVAGGQLTDKRRAGGMAGVVGLTEAEMIAEKERVEKEFSVPRNMQSVPIDPTIEALDPA